MVDLGVRRQRLIFGVLALRAGKPVQMGRLIEVAWFDQGPPATARNAIQVCISRLRPALAGFASIVTVGDGYQLDTDRDNIDLHRFRQCVAAARKLDGERVVTALRHAERLWRGPVLAGELSDAARQQLCAGLDDERIAATEERIGAELRLGHHRQLIGELTDLVRAHPTRERMIGHLMLALYRDDQTARALEVCRHARTTLADELGIDPGTSIRELEVAILRQAPELMGTAYMTAPPATAPPAAAPPATAPQAPAVPAGSSEARQGAGPPAHVPRELPRDITDFTGRAGDMLRLYDLLSPAADPGGVPVAVVSGPGGMGKTTLAVHAAHRLSALFPDGQVFVELRGASSAPIGCGEILARYLRALAVDDHDMPVDTGQRAALFRSRVHGRRMLFVLDDADNVAQIRDSLPASSGCAVLITSRNQLRSLPGSAHVDLGPLDADDAWRLFGRVAGRRRAQQEPGAVGAMVQLCAGLPLAVRINAAQLAAQPDSSVAALAARLTDERRRLDQMRLDDLSVRSSFRVGYDSVAARPGGQVIVAALRRLCLTDGPHFGAGAAAALLGRPAADTRRILARLVDASLLQATAAGRYQLHELVRLFARERAEQQDTKAARAEALHDLLAWHLHSAFNAARAITPGRRHADPAAIPAAGEVIALDGPESALRWLDIEMPNLVCSVYQAEATGDHEIAWMLATALWDAFTLRGNWTDWIGTHEVALRSTRVLGDRHAEAWICSNLSTAYTRVGRVRDAIDCLVYALEAVREIGEPTAEAALLGNLGNAHQELGQLPQALDLYQQALAIHSSAGQRYGKCLTLLNIAEVRHLLGQHDSAASGYRESLALQTGDDHLTGIALAGLGDVSIGQGLPPDIAAAHYLRALEVHRRAGHRPGQAETLKRLAAALAAAGQHDEAARYRFEADVIRRELDHA